MRQREPVVSRRTYAGEGRDGGGEGREGREQENRHVILREKGETWRGRQSFETSLCLNNMMHRVIAGAIAESGNMFVKAPAK